MTFVRGAAAAMFVPHGLRLGPMRLTIYGLCAAAGLVTAMALARRCARVAGLDPERAWDAGVFAIISCFVASRVLLVAFDLKAFWHFPLLVLSLPSLTFGGMAIAMVMVWVYLRRKRVSILQMLDVFAAPGAVLAAWMELAHFLDGSKVGMPTTLPWGVQDPWNAALTRVHPVGVYGAVAAIGLGFWLSKLLRAQRERLGTVAAMGLMAGGVCAFGLDMLTQPAPAMVDLLLEPGQWVALMVMLAGAVLWVFAPRRVQTVGVYVDELSPAAAGAAEPVHTEVR